MEVYPITGRFSVIQSYQTKYRQNIYQTHTVNRQHPTENQDVKKVENPNQCSIR